MKNREKYSDEILAAIASGASCDFMKKTVIPLYIDGRESSENFCSTNSTTSKTAKGSRVAWRYCELVEDADEVSQ